MFSYSIIKFQWTLDWNDKTKQKGEEPIVFNRLRNINVWLLMHRNEAHYELIRLCSHFIWSTEQHESEHSLSTTRQQMWNAKGWTQPMRDKHINFQTSVCCVCRVCCVYSVLSYFVYLHFILASMKRTFFFSSFSCVVVSVSVFVFCSIRLFGVHSE